MSRRRTIALFGAVLLAACTPRGGIVVNPSAEAVGTVIPVFFATTRLPDPAPGLVFGPERSAEISFGRIDVSIPPNRTEGDIRYPDATPDPATEFVATTNLRYADRRAFRSAVAGTLRETLEREVVIYVHGFNSTFGESHLRLAQLSHDLETPGIAVQYAWPSASNPLGYIHDRDSVLFARDGLEELIETVREAGAQEVVIVAHSLGSLLVLEALRQMDIAERGRAARMVDGVILASPDLDIDLFRSQAAAIDPLPEPFVIFTSQRDRALRLSARITRQPERLGNLSDVEQVADLDVTLLDVTQFGDGSAHLTLATSPTLLSILLRVRQVDAALADDPAARVGLVPGTILTVQNATQVILSPIAP